MKTVHHPESDQPVEVQDDVVDVYLTQGYVLDNPTDDAPSSDTES